MLEESWDERSQGYLSCIRTSSLSYPMASTTNDSLLNTLIPQWHALLKNWARKGSLSAAAQEALMLTEIPEGLGDLVSQYSSGDFHGVPEIALLYDTEMNGAIGAYAITTGEIYLNVDWLRDASQEQIFAVLTEELGHHLDSQFNLVDAPGDEGEFFARLLAPTVLQEGDKYQLRSQADHKTVTANGIVIAVEQASWPAKVADSVADFSGTQGFNNWYYGYFQAGALNPSGFIQLPIFTETSYGGYWNIGVNYWTALDNTYGHPNGPISTKPGGTEQWAVRRWISPFNGQIIISGVFDDSNKGGGGDGVTGYIFADGQNIYTQTSTNSTAPFEYSISIDVRRNSIVDFTASPRAWDGDDTYQFTALITQTSSNEAPTNLILTSIGILENSTGGTVIGTLSAVDPDSGSSFTYVLAPGNGINDADNSLVTIVDSQVIVKAGAVVDFETNPTLDLHIQVTDNGKPSLRYTKAVTGVVLDVAEDTVAPVISRIKVEGTSVILKFSESISAASVPVSAFVIAVVDNLNRVTPRTVSAIALDQNDSSVVILILTGAAPAVTSNLRVSYTDPVNDQETAVIQDVAGNDLPSFANRFADTFSSSITATLGSQYLNLILTGTSAINGTGNQYANTLTGNVAKNTLNGGEGVDYMAGGMGDDAYIVDNVDDYIKEEISEGNDRVQSSVTYTLSANLESLILTGSSEIDGIGNESPNTITGNSADNIINGGAGADTMAGGFGNDTYIVDHTGDLIKEAATAGTDTVWSSVTYSLSANLEILVLTGVNAINGIGNSLNNTIIGNIADNLIDGGVGADTMRGGLGNDTYIVDNVADLIEEGILEGSDTVQASISYSIASLSNLENIVLSGSGTINATGNTLSNILKGNSASNLLDGGAGADNMIGGLGNDVYIIDDSGDTVIESVNAGADSVRSSVTHALGANIENLILIGTFIINGNGNSLNNTITGNASQNVLNGGDGNDVLIGGLGQDTLIGSNGIDKFVYNLIEESSVDGVFRDTIVDFNGSAGERIDLSRIDAFTGLSGNQAFTFIGANSFTGLKGEVRFSNGVLLMNTDTDQIADMEIALAGVTAFQSSFLVL